MALDEVLPFAEECGVPLAIEPMHSACARDWTFLTDVAGVTALIDEYSSRYLKIACDLYHFPARGLGLEALKRLAPYVGIVHLCDRRREPTIEQARYCLGDGELPIQKMIDTLQAGGYAGSYDVKLMGPEVEPFDYWTLLERSHCCFSALAPIGIERSLA
jgi:sugar phosphate isomerase/epimerase